MTDFIASQKKEIEKTIPSFESKEFAQFRDKIREDLQKKENDLLLEVRRQKILLLGDWNTDVKKQELYSVKDALLKSGLYAETIDAYYDIRKQGGLNQIHILEDCCIKHQLIVFIDGDGPGTLTEQTYLRERYGLQTKVLFLIGKEKFDSKKKNPACYFSDFLSILPYGDKELVDSVVVFSLLRAYRLARIIQRQAASNLGPNSNTYEPWNQRLNRPGRYTGRKR